ncbi:MAG: FAD-binding oxidoreductase [Halioglobus sp.]|nr:FAD-binding oxidoreductase [Halioglobus sp.]
MPTSAHVDSWYAASANRELDLPVLQGELTTDVCIVGGGYTGLSSAIHLRERGYEVALLEANRIGWGASGRNGGHVDTGQRLGQRALEKLVGPDRARALWRLGLEAVDTVENLIERHGIECELKRGNLHLAAQARHATALRREAEHLQRAYDYPRVRFVPAAEIGSLTCARGFHGGLLDTGARHLHPLNYALGLGAAAVRAGARLFEGSAVRAFEEGPRIRVTTDRGAVRARFLILACNGYLGNLAPRAAARIAPLNNYMLATQPLPATLAARLTRDDAAMSDTLAVINYWKLSADNRLLFGGGETLTGRAPGNIGAFVRRRMLRIYPELADTRIDYGWGGTLAVTRNRMPDFGRLAPAVYYAQGYSGHGVPIATLAGKLIAEAVAGSAERFDVMASVPAPPFPKNPLLRRTAIAAALLLYRLRDRLG